MEPGLADAYIKRAETYLARKDYDQAWADVHRGRHLGTEPDAEFLQRLIEESGRSE